MRPRMQSTRTIRRKARKHERENDSLSLLRLVEECCDEVSELRKACWAMLDAYDTPSPRFDAVGMMPESLMMPSIAWDTILDCLGETYGDRI